MLPGYAIYEVAVNRLIYTTVFDVGSKKMIKIREGYPEKSAKQIIKEAIGLGCGGTIHPHIDGFWAIDYYPGIRVIAVNEKMENIKLSTKLIISMAETKLKEQYLKEKTEYAKGIQTELQLDWR